jgi:hypothetical protein
VEVVQGEIEKHCEDNMGQHLLLLLNSLQNQKLSIGVQSQRIQLIEKVSNSTTARIILEIINPYAIDSIEQPA